MGIARGRNDFGRHLVTSRTEHKAVLDPCKYLQKRGWQISWLEPQASGLIDPEALRRALRSDTQLVSIMHANNETGVVQDIAAIAAICREAGVLLHVDAAQSLGKLPLDAHALDVDLLSLSAHKMYGPKGVGALYVRRKNPRVKVTAQMDGGGHERGMRSGTLNVPGIVGFGKACEIAMQDMEKDTIRLSAMRNRLEKSLVELEESYINGNTDHRLPHVTNISFKYVEGEGLMMAMKDLAVSSGSACTSASLEPSYVLKSLGLNDDLAHSSIRFGLGRFTTDEEIDYAIECTKKAVNKLRDMSPLWEMFKDGIDLDAVEWAEH